MPPRTSHSLRSPTSPATDESYELSNHGPVRPAFIAPPRGPLSADSEHSNPYSESRYGHTSTEASHARSTQRLTEPMPLPVDPQSWGANLRPSYIEDDDSIHNPDPKRDKKEAKSRHFTLMTRRGIVNIGCLTIVGAGLLALFIGYPVATYVAKKKDEANEAKNAIVVSNMPGHWDLVDADTPEDAKRKKSPTDGKTNMVLVFSDEFNVAGRSFYPGDDPYWEAVDLHYWGTNNYEWYDPAGITTEGGALVITLEEKETHGLHHQGGLMSTWNQFCFTGGLVEASVTLPGSNNVRGLWPAVWTMGNLGRAGFGASLDGMWPYTYDSCDVGTLPNQTLNGAPAAAVYNPNGDEKDNYALSYLPGQRLSRCTCEGESHPGPKHTDGTFVGRSAPEIDIFEAQVDLEKGGHVSQSGQWAPFNSDMRWFNNSDTLVIYDEAVTEQNTYWGGSGQQTTSCVSMTAQDCYELQSGCFSVYGFEYKPGFDDAFITWLNDDKLAWTFKVAGTAADSAVEIGARPVPQEPMYLLANLGMSENFGAFDIELITFPAKMRIDWIRVYQNEDSINIGCDPEDFPTAAYIEQYKDAYYNANLTTWEQYNQINPKNSLVDQC